MTITSNDIKLTFSEDLTCLKSLVTSRELLSEDQPPLFSLRARDRGGNAVEFTPRTADIKKQGNRLIYTFPELILWIHVQGGTAITWSFEIENHSELALEYLDIPSVSMQGKLRANGGDCAIVSSYNEGLLVEDANKKPTMTQPEYPSQGGYMMYPYMLSTPVSFFLYGNEGLSMWVKDAACGPKGLDFCCKEDVTQFRTRLFLGGAFGENAENHMEIQWEWFEGDWQAGAGIIRDKICKLLPAKPLSAISLPSWYTDDMPLVLTYPVRGIHDMDEMTPNKLFPYHNVFPLVEEFAQRTGSRIMVLLMHWEGTAPWAPPYVWPPYGGEEMFFDFLRKLHRQGHLLGVYCSGFGFTERSNLIESYCNTDCIERNGLKAAFTRAPDQSLPYSKICTGQRSGYDICPASAKGRTILDDALAPLLDSGVDYIQALDQNHGGGMYFCYGQNHGHPPVPGGWMTEASQDILKSWKDRCPQTLLGCESAAAEPYIDSLRLSDNRYELCFYYGKPIPLYAFLYHSYLHNFMGNQVSCHIAYTTEGFLYRIAYSFTAGDLITLVLNEDGEIMFHWGMRDFSKVVDRDTTIKLCASIQKIHKKHVNLFKNAKMMQSIGYQCDKKELLLRDGSFITVDTVLSTAWDTEGEKWQLFCNYTEKPQNLYLENPVKDEKTGEKVTELSINPFTAVAFMML